MKTKLEYAQELIQRGFKIFPIKAGAKAPPLVKDFPRASEDCAQMVNTWWAGKDSNIGIHCKDLLVLDIDKKNGGFESLAKLEIENELPDTLECETPSGGLHCIYALPGGTSNSAGKIAAGIDVRSNNGYIVGPGSNTTKGPYIFIAERPIALAPNWLANSAGQTGRHESVNVTSETVTADQSIAAQRAADWLKITPPAIEGQGGDPHTFSVICRVRDFGVAEDHALEVLLSWNETCQPPWDPEELQRKIANAYKYAQNPAGSRSVESMFDVVVQENGPFINNEHDNLMNAQQDNLTDEEMYGPDDVSINTVLLNNYIIKGWLDHGTQAMLFGQWGSGKTFIALHMAAHIAADKAWFGNRVCGGGVLYFGYEGPLALQRRVYAIRKEFPDWDLDGFKLRPLRWPLVRRGLVEGKLIGQQKLEHALRVFKQDTGAFPVLVIIDPLRNALGGSDSDPDLTAPFLEYLQKLSKKTGCAFLTVHHPGHGDAERGRGDSGIEAFMDTVIKVDGTRGRIETRKQRDDPASGLYYRLKIVELGEDADGDTRTTCVVEPVMANILDPSLTDEQQRVYDKAKEMAGENGTITKTQFNRAAHGLTKILQSEILDILEKKRYLVPEGNKWRVGLGAAEMFN